MCRPGGVDERTDAVLLSLNRKADYALVAMADLARKSPATVSARDMAERLGVPLAVLQNVLTQLMHRGLVESVRGPRGGYRLRRPAHTISIATLIEAVGRPFRFTLCCSEHSRTDDDDECHMEHTCAIREPVRKVHSLLQRFLSEITLADVAWNRVPVRLAGPDASVGNVVQIV